MLGSYTVGGSSASSGAAAKQEGPPLDFMKHMLGLAKRELQDSSDSAIGKRRKGHASKDAKSAGESQKEVSIKELLDMCKPRIA